MYVPRCDGNVSAWNATTGADVWQFQTAAAGAPADVDSSPVVYDGKVYFSASNWNIYAVDALTGQKVWDAAHAPNWDGTFTDDGIASPVIADGILYIAGGNGLYSFDANTGAQLHHFIGSSGLESVPSVSNGIVYIGTSADLDNVFYALDAKTLDPVWLNVTPDNAKMYSSPAVANGVVYVGTSGQGLFAVGTNGGTVVAGQSKIGVFQNGAWILD